ncbi:MAG: ATP-binding protein, partial [Opitutaceae bacterium]
MKLKIAVACTLIALAGAAVGGWSHRARNAAMRLELLEDARRSTVGFDAASLGRLSGSSKDVDNPDYQAAKDRLRKLKLVDPRVRYVYLLRFQPETGKLVFLADSAATGTTGESMPGKEYAPGARSTGLRAIIQTGHAVTDGPLADAAGTWITAYATVGDPGGGGRRRDILGVDVDAAGWRRELWAAALQGAFIVWSALGLPVLAWYVARRQIEQRYVIRNLSQAVEQSHSAIVIIDLDNRIEFANRGMCEQIGYSRHELIGRSWHDFRVTEASEDVLADLVATVRAGRSWEGEWFNRRQNGAAYPVHGVVTPVKNHDGSLACFVAIFDDVTETKNREAELREARDRAEAGDRAKGYFLATMSHEVRTPLNGIVGFTSLLLDTPLNAEQREYIQTIRLSTEALIQLTGDILDFARIESGKLKLDPVACDPRECVEAALDMLAPKADAKKIALLHRVGDDVPSAVVADSGRLRQVLANLIGNAVKFTERGEVEVSVRRLPPEAVPPMPPADAETCMIEFAVRDTGIGIAPEHHTRLFRAFSQVDETTTRRYGGTGLGLAICRNLVELMGGTIELQSEQGQGATFTFSVRALVAGPPHAPRELTGLKLGLVMPAGGLRRELADLVRRSHGQVAEVDAPGQLSGSRIDIALVETGEEEAQDLSLPDPLLALDADKLLGLVPITLSNHSRSRLRAHYRLLINKPVHHDAFLALLAGSMGGVQATPNPPPHFGFRVLVAEDNVVNQRLVNRVLSNLGCEPATAENGRQVLEMLRQNTEAFDLVLLDLHMPEVDGLAALRDIRSGAAGVAARSIWVIALTADVREQQRVLGMAAGLNDYLTKPLKPSDLEAALRRYRT